MSETSETRTEWGVRLTWPDGHREVRTHGRMHGRPYQRRDAEVAAEATNECRKHGETDAIAEVVCRVLPEWSTLGQLAAHASGHRLVEATTGDGTPSYTKVDNR